uniref:Uncharacterized protein n=1 Tax=Arundo donax TaxID=35708 RepID=A0A0A9EIP5_ARUDO
MFIFWALSSVVEELEGKQRRGRRRPRLEHKLKDELTLIVSEKMRVSCICTSSRVLPLLPKDPTASTIIALPGSSLITKPNGGIEALNKSKEYFEDADEEEKQ